MAPTAPRRLALVGLAASWLVPLPARAWTEARVTTASAVVTVAPDGAADVALELGLSIHAGWLEGLEIAGLDPDLELDAADEVRFVSEEGERFTPTVTSLAGGRVSFTFPRREAPRRGRYRTVLRYRTMLGGRATTPTGRGTVRFEWTMPGWQSGLDGVLVQIVAPRGAFLPEGEIDAQATIDFDRREDASGTVLAFRRAHLPRTVPWIVAFEVPEEEVSASLRGPRTHAPIPRPTSPAPPLPSLPRSFFMAVALFVALAVSKRVAFTRAGRRLGAMPRPLIPTGVGLYALLALASGAASVELARRDLELWPIPLFALVLLSVQRPVRMVSAPRLGAFRRPGQAHFAAARRAKLVSALSPVRFLDASHPFGATITALCAGGILLMAREDGPWPFAFGPAHAASLLVGLMLTCPSTRLPMAPVLRLGVLRRLATRLRVSLDAEQPAFGLLLLVHEDADGRMQDARIRVATEHRPRGLVRLDIAHLERDDLGGHRSSPVVVLVTRAGSPAELAVADAFPHLRAQQAPAGRRARILALAELTQALTALADAVSVERLRPTEPSHEVSSATGRLTPARVVAS
jgi:hypothetical protein